MDGGTYSDVAIDDVFISPYGIEKFENKSSLTVILLSKLQISLD